jgi:hypothetical protein
VPPSAYLVYAYQRVGHLVTLTVDLDPTTITGTDVTELYVQLPFGPMAAPGFGIVDFSSSASYGLVRVFYDHPFQAEIFAAASRPAFTPGTLTLLFSLTYFSN